MTLSQQIAIAEKKANKRKRDNYKYARSFKVGRKHLFSAAEARALRNWSKERIDAEVEQRKGK